MIYELTPINSKNYKSEHVALGFFDGLHQSHMKVLSQHPVDVILFANVPSKEGFLYNLPSRVMQLEDIETVNNIYIYNVAKFNLSAVEFVKLVLEPLGVTDVYCGSDYSFGSDQLKMWQFEKFFKLHLVDEDQLHSKVIKADLKNRYIQKVNRLLKYPYYRIVTVVEGNGEGTKLGFPTANSILDPELFEMTDGVYQTKVWYNHVLYDSLTFIGVPETQGTKTRKQKLMETYIIDFKGKIYGKELHIRFMQYISEVKAFESVDELKAAISNYVELAKMLSDTETEASRKKTEAEIAKIQKSLSDIDEKQLKKYLFDREQAPFELNFGPNHKKK